MVRILFDYLKNLEGIFYVLLLLFITAALSCVIVFPLWFVSTNYAELYNYVIVGIGALALFIYFIIKSVRTKTLLPILFSFILLAHLIGIFLLFLHKNYLLSAILALDYFISMELSRNTGILLPVFRKILMITAGIGFLYIICVLFTGREWFYGILYSVIWLAFLCVLVYGKKKSLAS
ncbi:MAG: hypothetical protein JW969_07565 [Spirochaetales bacterium]|nr:hypothetical protein [Spirochaetales bacterium]